MGNLLQLALLFLKFMASRETGSIGHKSEELKKQIVDLELKLKKEKAKDHAQSIGNNPDDLINHAIKSGDSDKF